MNKLIRYIFSIISGALIFCALYCSLVFWQLDSPTKESLPFEIMYKTIDEVAKSFDQKKLVIVAGSSSSFGIMCKMIHQTEGIPCVNGGVHAALDIDYIFYRARSWLQSGDTVLLPLEYNHYTSDGKPGKQMVDYIFSYDSGYLSSTNIITKVRLIFGADFSRIADGISAKLQPSRKLTKNDLFSNRNQYGDIISNKKSDMTSAQILELSELKPLSVIDGYIQPSHGMASIKDFIDWCRFHQINVIATYPNTIYFPTYEQKRQQDFFLSIKDFYDQLDVPIAGHPLDSMYDVSMFFNTIYHPNNQGAKYRTEQLINELKPFLNSQSKKLIDDQLTIKY